MNAAITHAFITSAWNFLVPPLGRLLCRARHRPPMSRSVDRLVSTTGLIGLAGRRHPVGSHFTGRRGPEQEVHHARDGIHVDLTAVAFSTGQGELVAPNRVRDITCDE